MTQVSGKFALSGWAYIRLLWCIHRQIPTTLPMNAKHAGKSIIVQEKQSVSRPIGVVDRLGHQAG